MNKKIRIAIDGTASSGKSSAAKAVAKELGIFHFNTGNIFRAYATLVKEEKPSEETIMQHIEKCVVDMDENNVYLNNQNVTDKLKAIEIAGQASYISQFPLVRKKYNDDIRRICKDNSVVMDGRDIGTVVLPDADFKFFLTASAEERAWRRMLELNKNSKEDYKAIYFDIKTRDHNDSTRAEDPLKKASDAIEIDTDKISLREVIETILKEVRKCIK